MAIAAERLRENQTILVTGKVTFSHITRQRTGDNLRRHVEAQRNRGQLYPTNVPHTNITLTDAQVLYADQNAPSDEEKFVAEKQVYTSKTGQNAGKTGYGIDDKSNFLPPVFVKGEDGNYSQITPEGELDAGLDVTLVLRTFKPKEYEKRGVGLQQILVNEPIRYYSNQANAQALAAHGITISGPVNAVPADQGVAETVPENTAVNEDGHALPTPGSAAPAPAQEVSPAAAPAADAPAAPTAPQKSQKEIELERELAAIKAANTQQSSGEAAPGESAFDAGSPWG